MRVCIDFRDLNRDTPMDGYPMPIADLLVDAAAGHKDISFMDGNAGYNQIFMAIEDISKTAFRCPGHTGLFEGVAMTCSFHQAIPRCLQVTVPVRDDWKREQLLEHEDLSLSMGVK
jgi:hypothetical protein